MAYRHLSWITLTITLTMTIYWLGAITTPLHAAPATQIVTVRGAQLQGELPYQYNAHYLGLEPNLRDGLVSLTLAYDPQNNPNLKGFVSFFALDEDGLRRFLAGADPRPLAIAGGSPLQFDPIGNKVGAAFRVSGRGEYTVIVYNNAPLPTTNTLQVEGGLLVDHANQTLSTIGDTTIGDTTTGDTTPATPTATPTSSVLEQPSALGGASGQRLTGALSNTIGRHYLQVAPGIRDGTILFNLHYDPLDQPTLHGNVNFWILDQAGLNAIIRGDKPGAVNLATGFPAPFSPFPNDLQANFNASGKDPYTVVIYNQTALPATYDLLIDGGILYDRYGQTNEAKAAAATNGITTVAPTVTPTPITVAATDDERSSMPFGVAQLAGNFQRAYQYHYFALAPTLRNGTVILSLAFEPSDSQAVRENLNFWVLTEEGLQQVLNGAPPATQEIATGAYQEFGPYKGNLYSAFNASGRGKYTVIVYSNTETAARYLLNIEGGLLATEESNVTLP